jgi:hypothetical protein
MRLSNPFIFLTLGVFLLSACGGVRTLDVNVTEVEAETIIQAHPKPIKLNDIQWFVVTEENFEEFKKELKEKQGEVVWFAITPKDYEAMALNMQEMLRLIKQQKSIIVFYENILKTKNERLADEKANKEQPKSGFFNFFK